MSQTVKDIEVSPVFLILLSSIIIIGAAIVKFQSPEVNFIFPTIFAIGIWIIGLCLHEFSHALVSFVFGDKSIIEKGYLSLNPMLYSDIGSSIVFPIIILLMGGVPLPGGAVYLRHDLLKTKFHIALTYLSGPMANVIFGIVLCIIYNALPNNGEFELLKAMVALSAYLQFYTAIFNLLPIPSFDGFGALSIFFPAQLRANLQKIGAVIFIIILLAAFKMPYLFTPLTNASAQIAANFGVNPMAIDLGFQNFMGGH
jgi:Zn-dependent protease